jgi:hypothetical protein
MTYQEIRDIVRDVVENENSYRERELQSIREDVRRIEDTLYQLAEYLNLNIRRQLGVRIEPFFPEATAGINGPSLAVTVPSAPYPGSFGQSIGSR